MAAGDIDSIRQLIRQRLIRINDLVPTMEDEGLGVLAWLRKEMMGPLNGLRLAETNGTAAGGSGRVDIDVGNASCGAMISISDEMAELLLNVFSEMAQVLDQDLVLDNFLLHEIVHRAQGMGNLRHRGLSNTAATLLAECVYEADACAALLQTALDCAEDQISFTSESARTQVWRHYRRNIRSVLGQIQTFALMNRREKPISMQKARKQSISQSRWERIAAWHWQYHRAYSFYEIQSPLDLQILFRPRLTFRNADYAAHNRMIRANWPAKERLHPQTARVRGPEVSVCFVNRWGLREIKRLHAFHSDYYDTFFEGMFECDVVKTRHLLRPYLSRDSTSESSDLVSDPEGGRRFRAVAAIRPTD